MGNELIFWIIIFIAIGGLQLIVKIFRALAGKQVPPGKPAPGAQKRDVARELREFLEQLNKEFGAPAPPKPAPPRQQPRQVHRAPVRPQRREVRPGRRAVAGAPRAEIKPARREVYREVVGEKPLADVKKSAAEIEKVAAAVKRPLADTKKPLVDESELVLRLRPAAAAARRRRARQSRFVGKVTWEHLRQAVIWHEILSPPRAFRPWSPVPRLR